MITISTELGIGIVVALASAITFLFRLLMLSKDSERQQIMAAMQETIKTKDDVIGWQREELRQALQNNARATKAAESATTVAQRVIEG